MSEQDKQKIDEMDRQIQALTKEVAQAQLDGNLPLWRDLMGQLSYIQFQRTIADPKTPIKLRF